LTLSEIIARLLLSAICVKLVGACCSPRREQQGGIAAINCEQRVAIFMIFIKLDPLSIEIGQEEKSLPRWNRVVKK